MDPLRLFKNLIGIFIPDRGDLDFPFPSLNFRKEILSGEVSLQGPIHLGSKGCSLSFLIQDITKSLDKSFVGIEVLGRGRRNIVDIV